MARFSKAKTEALELMLRPLIEEERLQQHAAATMLGVSEDWVQRACTRLGLATQRTGPRAGEKHPGWKHGVRMRKGYRYLYVENHPTGQKYAAEHRLVVERILGRILLASEVVHHRDGNPLNNQPSNLEVFSSNAQHLRHELSGRVPNWTPDGRKRIAAGVEKSAAMRRQRTPDDDLPPRPIAHPT